MQALQALLSLAACFVYMSDAFSTVTKPAETAAPAQQQTDRKLGQEWVTIFPPSIRPLTVVDHVSRPGQFVVHEQPHQLGPLYRHMMRHCLYKLPDDTVVLYNPIGPTEEILEAAITTFGKAPDHIIIPTDSYEHLCMTAGWIQKFPDAIYWALPGVGLDGTVKNRRDLKEDALPHEWSNIFDVAVLNGGPLLNECYWLHKPTKTVFTLDSFNMINDEFILNSVGKAAISAIGSYNKPSCSTSFFMWKRADNRRTIERVLSWDFDTVIGTHGVIPIPGNGKDAIREAFSWLLQ